VNLSEFPESLLEAELFGHEKGAFTGALERRDGVFASGSPHGSIFLDEIGELSAPVQIKLLRVLQERTFTAVGSRKPRRFRGRVIAATNRDIDALRGAGDGGLLREDLYYRLCSDLIVVPPLRQRLAEAPGELEALVRTVLSRTLGPSGPDLLAPVCATIERDVGPRYAWPGNVRELEQCVRRILLKGRYDGLRAARTAAADGDPFFRRAAAGELDADELLGGYCARLHAQLGSYEAVARRTRLDRRTVKRYAELAAGHGGTPDGDGRPLTT
jgi:transcriptional regulator with GAF, ATPase, and Fis domain